MNKSYDDNERLREENARLRGMLEAYERILSSTYSMRPTSEPKVDTSTLKSLTTKQHCALQLLLHGASNQEIAERIGVTESTAKTYVRGIMKKFEVRTRAQLAMAAKPQFDAFGDEEYLAMASVPKDWSQNPESDREYQGEYYGARK